MKKQILASLAAAALAVASVAAQQTASRTRAYVETLASERFEGRLAGSNGERLASEYLVAELQKIGAKPLPGRTDFLLPFDFTAGTRDGGSFVEVQSTRNNARALSCSDNGDVTGPIVFAGYGI